MWNLPTVLPTPPSNYWALKAKKLILNPKIVSISRDDDFSYLIYGYEEGYRVYPQKVFLADYQGYVENEEDLVELLIKTVSHYYKDNISFTRQTNTISMSLTGGTRIEMGKKLAEGLGLDLFGETTEDGTLLYVPGKRYTSLNLQHKFREIFKPTKLVHVYINIIKPSICSNGFKQLLYTASTKQLNEMEGNYHDLDQSPVTSAVIYFSDEYGNPLYFSSMNENDFVFCLELEFKKLFGYT